MLENDPIVISRFIKRYWLRRLPFRLLDKILAPLTVGAKGRSIPPPRSILLANSGHLGDLIISTSLLPVLTHAFPGVRIGFLVGSWSQAVARNHPLVDRVHVLDHWYFMSRNLRNIGEKLKNHWRQRRQVINEIRYQGYEVAIDLRVWFHHFVPALWEAGIPYRIGYDFGGFASLLTHVVNFQPRRMSEAQWEAELLRFLPIPTDCWVRQRQILALASVEAKTEVRSLLRGCGSYRVMHVGTNGGKLREWPSEKWKTLARILKNESTLVFTGRGAGEKAAIAEIAARLPNCLDACDRLSWDGLVELVRGAELVYSVDTSVGHVASAVGTPSVAIFGGITDHALRKPMGKQCVLAIHNVPCLPCFRRKGCEAMTCLRELPVESVLVAGKQALQHGHAC